MSNKNFSIAYGIILAVITATITVIVFRQLDVKFWQYDCYQMNGIPAEIEGEHWCLYSDVQGFKK